MCAVRAVPEQVARWRARLDRETFEAVARGRGSADPVAFHSLRPDGSATRTLLVAPGDVGGAEGAEGAEGAAAQQGGSACKTIASFVRDARPEQQDALWREVGERLRERAAIDAPTWVSTDGTGVHWLHVRLCEYPGHFKHDPYKQRPPRH